MRRVRVSRRVAWLSLAAILSSLGALPATSSSAIAEGGVRVLGKLPLPPDTSTGTFAFVDAERRFIYLIRASLKDSNIHLTEYDLRSRIPTIRRDVVAPGFPSNNTRDLIAFDPRTRIMYAIDIYTVVSGTVVHRFDVGSMKALDDWNLNQSLPGFVATGITYSTEDDRVYLIGDTSGGSFVHDSTLSFGARPPASAPVAVAALEASTSTPTVAWIKPIPGCLEHLSVFTGGGFIGRSATYDALYFFCFSGGANVVTAFPGVTGLVRLSITPKGTQSDALSFPVELFPVSGSYAGGLDPNAIASVTLDRPSDRVFVQSLSSTTPGAWVFDGTISAWVGLIAAPNALDRNLGVNEGTGHYYIGTAVPGSSDKGYLIVSNARMTPPPQGDVLPFNINGPIVTDPKSKRLFVLIYQAPAPPLAVLTPFVLEDNTPDPEIPTPVDYDELTTDIEEGPGTLATYSGGLTGYGARAFAVGGVGGARSFLNTEATDGLVNINQIARDLQLPVPALKPGDRGLYLSRVDSVDLSGSGASANAQAVALDDLSADDFENLKLFVEANVPPTKDQLKWPWPAAACLDGEGKAVKKEEPGPNADSFTNCDLAGNTSESKAYVNAVSVGPLVIGGTSFDAAATRDRALGTVGTATAVAKGIELNIPGLGGLSIGRVFATAKAVAHGRPGTAHVDYERKIQDVAITDATGKETFACAATCDPEEVADQVNTQLGLKIRMDVPKPDKDATARGAYARVQKGYADYIGGLAQNNDSSFALPAIQLTINNDSASKSRLLVQLAAIQANSIYGISIAPEDYQGGDDGGLPPIGPPEQIPGPATTVTNTVVQQQEVRVPVGGLFRGAFLLARSPKDLAIVMLIFLVIAGSVASAYRRHSLIRHLEDESV